MKKDLNFDLGIKFKYNKETKLLTLTDFGGMTCGHNKLEDDFSCSGLFHAAIDSSRYEGAKLQYEILSAEKDKFCFNITDAKAVFKVNAVWNIEKKYNLVSCKYSLTNTSGKEITVRRALPRFVFTPGDYEVYHQLNRWSAENQLQCLKLAGADIYLHGRPARSSVGSAPFAMLKDTENCTALAFHVLPVGNWQIQVRSDILSNESPTPVVEAGLADTDLYLKLAPGASIELPELIIQLVPQGDLKVSGAKIQRYMIDKRLPSTLNTPPVIYNTWLYRFTNFSVEQLREQLKSAKEIGCETFIIDAGWFGPGESWGGVGDWREKDGKPFFGNMSGFADEVRAAGLDFGFWIEPERWVPNIPIRNEHPEWFPENTTRIDLTIPAAAEHFHDVIADNVRKFKAKYIKVDFNASVGYDESGSELYNYCQVLNAQFERLRKEFPDLLIENCGSGALRNDLKTAMIYDHDFVSDNANPFETLRIRQGLFMRSMPGRVLNWLVMRNAPDRRTKVSDSIQVLASLAGTWDEAAIFDLDYIMISGLLGIPGFSGDLAELSPEVKKRIGEYIDFYKENREEIINAHCYLLTPPDNKITDYEKYIAFQLQKQNVDDSLVFVFSNGHSRRGARSFPLHNLEAGKNYIIKKLFSNSEENITMTGADLMNYGIPTVTPENQHVRHTAALYLVQML